MLGNWNAKVAEDAFKNWTGTCGCYCNPETNERRLRLLEFTCYNDLVLANTLGKHLVSRRWTLQSPNGGYHNQIDYIMVRRCFMTSVNTTKTRSFQGADIGSDHDLVMLSFRLHLKRCCDKCLQKICNKIWQAGEWPIPITQSYIITLPKKRNLQQCKNYHTISLVCHPSKVLLKVLLNRLKRWAESIIAEEQAGFQAGRSTTQQIFNFRILCEKYLQHQQVLYHTFIDFKKSFYRVWHKALWSTMRLYKINANLIKVVENLYKKATTAIHLKGGIGD